MRFDDNHGRAKNYEPNSFRGPSQSNEATYASIEVHGSTGPFAWERHKEDSDFVQASDLYRLMPEDAKKRLVENISASLSKVSKEEIIKKSLENFRCADKDLGDRLEKAVRVLK